jgi:hypothetical protein
MSDVTFKGMKDKPVGKVLIRNQAPILKRFEQLGDFCLFSEGKSSQNISDWLDDVQ